MIPTMAAPDAEPDAAPKENDAFAGTRMTLGEHLEELRNRLVKGVGAVAIAFIAAFAINEPLVQFMMRPYSVAAEKIERNYVEQAVTLLEEDPALARTEFFMTAEPEDFRLRDFRRTLTWVGVAGQFFFTLRICLYAALVFGAPVLLWQMWQFIAAGLYRKEKRSVAKYFPLSLVAFAVGVSFGFLVIVPYGIYFLNKNSIEFGMPSITAQYFLSFMSGLCLAFGVVFQLPLVMTFLGSAGIVDPKSMGKYRGHFCVGAFFLSAMLTPPDPFTQLMMAVPLVVLYEAGIWSARVALARQPKPADA
jgi:sec-independent protein translocase protein TatC